MKTLKTKYTQLIAEKRWDIDYHLPPLEVNKYSSSILKRIDVCADIIREKRDPSAKPEDQFMYVDISSVDVLTGMIVNPQELLGEEAPSRARKVIHEGDIIISSCRPTRGAVAIVPHDLDDQICSTGFIVIRAKEGYNNQYLHFILRSALVKEQFRKFSTGSSYPAILETDVEKTIIPVPSEEMQGQIAERVSQATEERNQMIDRANNIWKQKLSECFGEIEAIQVENAEETPIK